MRKDILDILEIALKQLEQNVLKKSKYNIQNKSLSFKQHLTLTCIRVHPRGLRTITPSGQLQTISEKDPISLTSRRWSLT